MSITDLISLVKPPSRLIERGSTSVWEEIQTSLRIQLPNDYYEFGLTYSSGRMCDKHILIANWAAPHYRDFITGESRLIRSAGTTSFKRVAVFPDTPGLFPWGSDKNGSSLCWLITGHPSNWPVVVQSGEGEEYHFQLSMTDFLVNALLNRIKVPVWHEPFTHEELNFEPLPQ
jgi:hypothetical protein